MERGLPPGTSIFEAHPFAVVSLDYIESNRRRDELRYVLDPDDPLGRDYPSETFRV